MSSIPSQTPDVLPPAYVRMAPRWQTCRDLMGGTEAIRAGGTRYLPKLENESPEGYEARRDLAALFNGFERTALASVGMLGVQEPALAADMPEPLVALWEDVDGAGMHGAVFTAQLALEALVCGHAGIFVDAPPARAGLDEETARREGVRPYWILVRAEDEVFPYWEQQGGRRRLTMLIRKAELERRLEPFGVEALTMWYVYRRDDSGVTYERWEKPAGGTLTLAEGPVPMRRLTEIPYARVVAGVELEGAETKPPLMSLADLNLEHHRTKTNILHLEELGMVPTQVRIGAERDRVTGEYPPIVLGPRNVIEAPALPGVSQPVYWHSPPVDVLEPAMKTLAATETAMEVSGSAFLAPAQRHVETASAKKINARAQNATLSRVARALQDGLELAFQHTAAYLGLKAGSVVVPTNFEDQTLDPQAMTAYVAAVAQAGLPPRVLLRAWQVGGRIPADTDLEELELELVANMASERAAREAEDAARQQVREDAA